MPEDFPVIQPGGSLIIAWQVSAKKVLIVGGGDVAASRIVHCANADADITVVGPRSGLCPETEHRIALNQIKYIDRKFEPADLDNADMVLVAIDDAEESTRIWKMTKERKIPVNVADVPDECDFFFGSVHRDGPLQIMVSTNGRGPRVAASLRRRIAAGLPPNCGQAIDNVGKLRQKLREKAPDKTKKEISKRMKWMSKVCDNYSFEDLLTINDEDMDNLLLFYPANKVPPLVVLHALREDAKSSQTNLFDGSFGFSIGA